MFILKWGISMSENIELQAAIARIKQMEQYLDEVMDAVNTYPDSLSEDEHVREKIQELRHYYENGQWLQDYDCDAGGRLPADLKRGILSQDTLYDLLCEIEEQKNMKNNTEN